MTDTKLLVAQQEKPNHYTYLKEFRVEQCQSFLQHKCNQHRPFVCFNWHFQNQRRRRPIRKRDGTFNYSADNYCTKYDETTGICPDGDDCPFLHRTAGDTERRYHLRYYKTCMCVHDTDSRGYCVKNGHHCAFAHGIQDQRPPVYDIKELEALQNTEIALDGTNSQNALDKERNLMNEDPKWQDTNYVLANYKTEPCKRPPRLCRQGYACPQYHNSKDKRRSPRKFKYRSTPCPNVKHGEEWGEPGNCEAGDNCQYCHTRTEQQFHPEIYKSTKCNDVQQAGYCPRSVFCAFAHVEPYTVSEDKSREYDGISTTLALGEIISNALPHDMKSKDSNNKSGLMSMGDNNGNEIATAGEMNEKRTPTLKAQKSLSGQLMSTPTKFSTVTTSTPSPPTSATTLKNYTQSPTSMRSPTTTTATATATLNRLLQNLLPTSDVCNPFQSEIAQHQKDLINSNYQMFHTTAATAGATMTTTSTTINKQTIAPATPDKAPGKDDSNKIQQKQNKSTAKPSSSSSSATTGATTTELMAKLLGIDGNDTNNMLVNALEKSANQGKFLNFLPLGSLTACSIDDRDNVLSANLANNSSITRSSAPINIPNSTLNSSMNDFSSAGFAVNLQGGSLAYSPTNHTSNLFNVSDAFNYSGSNSNKLSNSLTAQNDGGGSSLFFPSRIISPGFADGLSISPSVRISELNSLRDEINSSSVGNSLFDNSLGNKNAFSLQSLQNQSSNNADIGRLSNELTQKNLQIVKLSSRIEDTARKLSLVEIQRDKAKQEALEWKERFDLAQTQLNLSTELRHLSIHQLKQLQSKLRSDMEEVDKVLYMENARKCMKCEENNRSVTLEPCNHFIVCDTCACSVTECPYCQMAVVTTHT